MASTSLGASLLIPRRLTYPLRWVGSTFLHVRSVSYGVHTNIEKNEVYSNRGMLGGSVRHGTGLLRQNVEGSAHKLGELSLGGIWTIVDP